MLTISFRTIANHPDVNGDREQMGLGKVTLKLRVYAP